MNIFRLLWLNVCWRRGHLLTAGPNAYCTTCHPERWKHEKKDKDKR